MCGTNFITTVVRFQLLHTNFIRIGGIAVLPGLAGRYRCVGCWFSFRFRFSQIYFIGMSVKYCTQISWYHTKASVNAHKFHEISITAHSFHWESWDGGFARARRLVVGAWDVHCRQSRLSSLATAHQQHYQQSRLCDGEFYRNFGGTTDFAI